MKDDSLIVRISDDSPVFNVSISSDNSLLFSATTELTANESIEDYDGDYVVIPKAHEETVLNTSGKKMMDDVTVKKVPYYATSNPTGTTVYIASEVM